MAITPTNGNGLWPKILAVIVPAGVAGLIAWGSLRSDVTHVAQAMDLKAEKETVTVEYQAIVDRLDAIDRRLERLEARR